MEVGVERAVEMFIFCYIKELQDRFSVTHFLSVRLLLAVRNRTMDKNYKRQRTHTLSGYSQHSSSFLLFSNFPSRHCECTGNNRAGIREIEKEEIQELGIASA